MYTLRTRFKKDVVTEFLPPARTIKKQRVIILADGMPTVPKNKEILNLLSSKGFWVFAPRYRGSWESDGKFLAHSPHKDILDVIDGIHHNFVSIWDYNLGDKKVFKLNPDEIILVGSSFGGPAVILAAQEDKRVNKTVAFSPVIDWRRPGKDEPIPLLAKFTEQAFGNGYRTSKNGWAKIISGKFYNPALNPDKTNGASLLMIQAKDDTVVSYSATKKFAKDTGAKLITLPRGGHLGKSILLQPRFYKIFAEFIKK
ncbi:MAG TPA: alpha/beta fold hydrolase [Patescibacteria group bacterium]|jgi:predicted alpha/beta hydrolase family esterase|nr:alpha/beta fold hydrolase [Patescibacteria group bacterium]